MYQKDYIVTDYLDERVTLLKGQPCVKYIDGGKEKLKLVYESGTGIYDLEELWQNTGPEEPGGSVFDAYCGLVW